MFHNLRFSGCVLFPSPVFMLHGFLILLNAEMPKYFKDVFYYGTTGQVLTINNRKRMQTFLGDKKFSEQPYDLAMTFMLAFFCTMI